MLVSGASSYYFYTKGEMDIATVTTILFLMSIAFSAYLVYAFFKKGVVARLWWWAVWEFLALMLLLSGLLSGDIVTMVAGIFLLFAVARARSDHVTKRVFEAIFLLAAFTAIVWGYATTKSPIFGIQLLLIAVLFFVAFILSYLLPKIRAEFKSYNRKGVLLMEVI